MLAAGRAVAHLIELPVFLARELSLERRGARPSGFDAALPTAPN